MRKVSVPIHMNTLNDDTLPVFMKSVKDSGVSRVFLCGLGSIFLPTSKIYTQNEFMRRAITAFRNEGFEVGVWVGGLGHGIILQHDKAAATSDMFTPLEGIGGETTKFGFCPYDDNFIDAYAKGIKTVAELGPDLIMIDDDFRISLRSKFYFGCFCKKHLNEYYNRLGEKPPRDALERLIYTGGKNKYRDTYRGLMRDTLLGFARKMRETVDSVNPAIRMASCTSCENWDANGTDMIELAKTFAGNTKPFTRVAGAPYEDPNIIPELDISRQQLMWMRDAGIEAMAEGDVYPRPRYNVSSKVLEIFDLVHIAANAGDGILNYIYDYVSKPDYETGYVDRYIRNASLRQQTEEIFKDKTTCGLEIFHKPHLIENWELPNEISKGVATRLTGVCFTRSHSLISKNAIPITFEEGDGPVFIVGENAKYIDPERLKNGAVLDIKAADILSRRGIDTGFISAEPCTPDEEYFIDEDDRILNIDGSGMRRVQCNEKATVLSRLMPYNSPSAYLYENEQGMRFMVMAVDIFAGATQINYSCSYYRQAQLIKGIQWVGKKPLPAVCTKNPNLYVIASKNDKAMSVALANIFLDDIFSPEITLDKEYSEIRFVNCNGHLEGRKVYLSDIPPYGFAAFEVK